MKKLLFSLCVTLFVSFLLVGQSNRPHDFTPSWVDSAVQGILNEKEILIKLDQEFGLSEKDEHYFEGHIKWEEEPLLVYNYNSPVWIVSYHEERKYSAMSGYPWKRYFVFNQLTGDFVGTLGRPFKVKPLKVFPEEAPFILAYVESSKGNGTHLLYAIVDGRIEQMLKGANPYSGGRETIGNYWVKQQLSDGREAAECEVFIEDIDKDGFNDIVFRGKERKWFTREKAETRPREIKYRYSPQEQIFVPYQ